MVALAPSACGAKRMTSVDIGIATYRRPALLAQLLESLVKVTVPSGCRLRVLVADNDPGGSAYDVVQDARGSAPWAIEYQVVVARGISHARNWVLAATMADYLAFVDDDERVPPGWLVAMLGGIERHGVDILFGPVTAELPPDAPEWARKHPAFGCLPGRAVRGVPFGRTGNVLLKSRVVRAPGLQFDPGYGLTGGEDTEFFHRAGLAGHTVAWCEEATVFEAVTSERLRLGWVLRRGFRGGQVHTRVFLADRPGPRCVAHAFGRVVLIAGAAVVLPVLVLLDLPRAVRVLTRAAGWLGQVITLIAPRWWYQGYATAGDHPLR